MLSDNRHYIHVIFYHSVTSGSHLKIRDFREIETRTQMQVRFIVFISNCCCCVMGLKGDVDVYVTMDHISYPSSNLYIMTFFRELLHYYNSAILL